MFRARVRIHKYTVFGNFSVHSSKILQANLPTKIIINEGRKWHHKFLTAESAGEFIKFLDDII